MLGMYNVFNYWIILFLNYSNKYMLRIRNFIEYIIDVIIFCFEVLILFDVIVDFSEWSKMWDKFEL